MIRLRAVHDTDKELLLTWRNLPEVAKYMYTDHLISDSEHEAWFNAAMMETSKRYWIITLNSEDVGLANITDIDEHNRRCFWAFYLASSSVRGQGVGSYVEYFVLSHVFDELGLNKLCCEVLEFNEAVVGMHKSFGFVEEGRFREHILKQGVAHDVVRLAMLRSEWLMTRPAIENRLRRKGLID